jgi:hypothetical protein
MALFFGSLTGIAMYNPGVADKGLVPVQAPTQQITIQKRDDSNSVVLAPQPRVTVVRPLVRSRGS